MDVRKAAIRTRSIHRLDARDLRNVVLEIAFDTHLEGHLAGGAADAGPVKANSDDTLIVQRNELNVAAVALHSGSNEVNDARDAIVDVAGGLCFAHAPLHWGHKASLGGPDHRRGCFAPMLAMNL